MSVSDEAVTDTGEVSTTGGAAAAEAGRAPNRVLYTYCWADFARALLSGLITSYLMVVFIPQSTSSLPVLLPAAAATFAIVRGAGSVVDAVIDPIIASWSDRSEARAGRRVPFLRWSVVPWGVSTALIVLAPVDHTSWWNAAWVAFWMLVNLVASSFYSVPYYALQAELVTDTRRRVWFFTINTLFFVVGSAVVFLSPVIKAALMGAGLSELASWQVTFAGFAVLGLISAAIPAFRLDERRWVSYTPVHQPVWASFAATFRYRQFVILLAGYFVMWVAFSLFNATLLYYVTMLMGAPESFSTVVSGIAIIVGVAAYWPINRAARRWGKKPLLVAACIAYVAIYAAIFSYQWVLGFLTPEVFAILVGVLIGAPISVTNILPGAAFADLTQYDAILTGVDRAGMFYASRNLITSLGQSLVLFAVPWIIAWGSDSGRATVEGVQLTAGVAAVAIAAATLLYWRYDDRGVTHVIDEDNARGTERDDAHGGVAG